MKARSAAGGRLCFRGQRLEVLLRLCQALRRGSFEPLPRHFKIALDSYAIGKISPDHQLPRAMVPFRGSEKPLKGRREVSWRIVRTGVQRSKRKHRAGVILRRSRFEQPSRSFGVDWSTPAIDHHLAKQCLGVAQTRFRRLRKP